MTKSYAYNPFEDRQLTRGADYYQDTAAQWHQILQFEENNTPEDFDMRAKQYARARWLMGLREVDYGG